MADGAALIGARLVLGLARRVVGVLPADARARLEDRFFYSVFQVSRVTNDHYPKRARPPEP